MANQIIIGEHKFKTQSEAKKFVKGLYAKYSDGETLTKEDCNFFIQLLKLRDDQGIEKIGCGVQKIFSKHNKYGKNTFWIERIDGSQTDFSIYKPLERKTNRIKHTLKEIDFRKACRTAIVEDKKRLKLKQDAYGVAHHDVDRFENLICDFIKIYQIDVESVELEGHKDGSLEISFIDLNLEKQWVEFHRNHANLKILSQDEHKQKHKAKSQPGLLAGT